MNRLVWVSVFAGLIIASHVTAQQPARSGDGSRGITGRVFNHNGQPLSGRKVFLRKVNGGLLNSQETFTSDTGEFRFDNLSHGVYTLLTLGAVEGDQQQFYRPGDQVTFRVKRGGVITGAVTDSEGEPLVTVYVRLLRVRDEHGRRVYQTNRFSLWQWERMTDDRGVYRFWGLEPGSYLVSVGGRNRSNENRISDISNDGAPTYHPSAATPEAAAEVSIQDGLEVAGIDIRHRNESGHAISGQIFRQVASGSQEEGIIVMLTQAASGASVGWKSVRATDGPNSFVFEGLADGEYDLRAMGVVNANPYVNAVSPHRRVIVKGKDVSGIEMKLAPLGSIDGRVVLEADRKQGCQSGRNKRLEETVIIVNGEGAEPSLPSFTLLTSNGRGTLGVPDQRGDFTIRPLNAAHYRIEAQLPNEDWYIRSINLPGPTQAKPVDVGRDGIAVKSGQRITGMTISLQEGAASVRGRVVAAQVNATLPSRLRVYLVPAEPQEGDNVIRFAEATAQSDGSFLLTNITPGRYWLLVRPADDLRAGSTRPLAWEREARAKLVRDAMAANNTIELQPCQRITDRILRYAPLATTPQK